MNLDKDIYNLDPKKLETVAKEIGFNYESFSEEKEKDLQKLLEEKLNYENNLKNESEQFIMNYFFGKYRLTPQQIIINYINYVDTLSHQDGYGHQFIYEHPPKWLKRRHSPDHWSVKPENYNLSQPSEDEQFAMEFYFSVVPKFKCYISPTANLKNY